MGGNPSLIANGPRRVVKRGLVRQEWRWVFGLVETHESAAGKLKLESLVPLGFLDFRTVHALGNQARHVGLEIVAHEKQLGGGVVGRM